MQDVQAILDTIVSSERLQHLQLSRLKGGLLLIEPCGTLSSFDRRYNGARFLQPAKADEGPLEKVSGRAAASAKDQTTFG